MKPATFARHGYSTKPDKLHDNKKSNPDANACKYLGTRDALANDIKKAKTTIDGIGEWQMGAEIEEKQTSVIAL
eukprot:243721-Pyramimonas_sp.AAC.1